MGREYIKVNGQFVPAGLGMAVSQQVTEGAVNPVSSGAVYAALEDKYEKPSGGIPDSDIASSATWNGKQSQHITQIVTLSVAGWSNNTQTVNVTGVTATNTVIVGPAAASTEDWTESDIYCSAQAAGTLTFSCYAVPANAVSVNVIILGV